MMESTGTQSGAAGERLQRARLSLEGLSVGDAFGEWFFSPMSLTFFAKREMPPKPWHYTDDTAMGISIVEILHQCGGICEDVLAERFARRYSEEPNRGYGGTAQRILREISRGQPWNEVARNAFDGMGSMGNGAAMRAGPVGAYFADDPEAVVEHAKRSAMVTHAHPDAQAGAIAVAVAASCAFRLRGTIRPDSGREMIAEVIRYTPDSATRSGLETALHLDLSYDVRTATRALGNGSGLLASDTVPFTIWSAAKHLGSYEEAMWATASAWGDMDTTCAIVGSIVVMATGADGIPELWRRSRESLDLSFR